MEIRTLITGKGLALLCCLLKLSCAILAEFPKGLDDPDDDNVAVGGIVLLALPLAASPTAVVSPGMLDCSRRENS